MIFQIAFMVLLLIFNASPARAQPKGETGVRGEIVGQGGLKFPIAVSPLKNLGATADVGKLSEGIADTIVYDLDLSGWFKVLDRAAYIENPQKSGVALGTFDFKDWSTIGAEGLVKGGFTIQGDEVTVELRLFDVFQNKERVGKRYVGRVKDYRRIAHKFADEIINQFTGVPGVFNTRIAYVSTSGGRFKEIHIAHLDGSEKFQLTNNHTINLSPSWTADGKSVLYTSYKDRNSSLYLFELYNGKETKIIPRNGRYLGGKASPDGQFIAATVETAGNSNIILLDRNGNVIRSLTDSPGIEVSPAWSPDSKQLVFVSDRSGSPQLYIFDVASNKSRRSHVQRQLQYIARMVAARRQGCVHGKSRKPVCDFYDWGRRRRTSETHGRVGGQRRSDVVTRRKIHRVLFEPGGKVSFVCDAGQWRKPT